MSLDWWLRYDIGIISNYLNVIIRIRKNMKKCVLYNIVIRFMILIVNVYIR